MNPDFDAFFANLPGAFMVLDKNHCYVAASDDYCAVVMRAREDLLGQNLFELFPNAGESGTRLKDSFNKVLETGERDTLAYIPYDIPKPEEQGGGMETRFWSATHSPVKDEHGITNFIIQNTTDVTELVRLREVSTLPFRVLPAERDLVARAQEVEEAHRQLLNESDEFKHLFQQAPGFFVVMSGPDHIFTFANDAYIRLVGGRDVMGQKVAEALPEVVGQGFVTLLDNVYTSGKSYSATGTRVMLEGASGQIEEHFLDFAYHPIRDADGVLTGIFVQGMDTTLATRANERQSLLIGELNHRVKNVLSSVRTIAGQTFRPGRDLGEARAIFDNRVQALARTHDMLVEREWSDADFYDLMRREFTPFPTARYVLRGPSVILNPKTSIALTLAIHELVTNAVKYGALAGDTGVVCVDWQVDDTASQSQLLIEWQERGGGPAKEPERPGFGTRLIQTVIRGELSGNFAAQYAETGFNARIAVPLLQPVHDI